jgi:hypothetical protein
MQLGWSIGIEARHAAAWGRDTEVRASQWIGKVARTCRTRVMKWGTAVVGGVRLRVALGVGVNL